MDIIGIYYQHFGTENTRERKKRHSLYLLSKRINDIKACADMIKHSTTIYSVCKRIKMLADSFDGCPPEISVAVMLNNNWFNACYRNHIYPAEVETPGSAFYGANVRLIDAILIDRNPSAVEHHRIRGGRWKHVGKFV